MRNSSPQMTCLVLVVLSVSSTNMLTVMQRILEQLVSSESEFLYWDIIYL